MQASDAQRSVPGSDEQGQSYSAGAASSVDRGKSHWLQAIQRSVRHLKGQDVAKQREAAQQIGFISVDSSALIQLENEVVASGAIEALSDALQNSDWEVKGNAALSLAALASVTTKVASNIPDTAAPVLLETLRNVQAMSAGEWRLQVAPSLRSGDVQASAAGLLGILLKRPTTGLVAVQAVPLLVDLLDVDSKENCARSTVARALGQIAANQAAARDAITGSGAINKIGEWLEWDIEENDLSLVAAEALGDFASCSEEMRDVMEESGVFDTLMTKLVEFTRKKEAVKKALMHWGVQRITTEIPNYT